MDWEGLGLAAHTLSWLEATGSGRYARERRLDPFATSMRDFDDVSAHLAEIKAGGLPEHSDPNQRITDLRSAELVEGSGSRVRLTSLGEAVLESWESFGVATDSKDDELARMLLLLIAARTLKSSTYSEFIKYWSELRRSFSAIWLINNWDTLYLLNYLDYEIDDYAPGTVYRDTYTQLDDVEFDLDDFADRVGASVTAKTGAERVRDAIAGKIPRGRARATFCIAMELLAGTKITPRLLLEAFGQPRRPRDWVAFSQSQIDKVEEILESYSLRLERGLGLDDVGQGDDSGGDPYDLPGSIDFGKVLRAAPRPAKKKAGTAAKGNAKKINYKQRNVENDFVGDLGEKFVLEYERWRLRDHEDLMKRVERLSLKDDTLGYDILSWETDGRERLVEVKSTLGPLETRFFISSNELRIAESNAASYVIVRVGQLKGEPSCCEIRYPFDELEIEPSVYSATFKAKWAELWLLVCSF